MSQDFDKLSLGAAAEIGKRMLELEKKVRLLIPNSVQVLENPQQYWYAKINTNHDDGTYDLTEQIINDAGDDYEDKKGGRKWVKDGTNGELKEAREINADVSLEVDVIVLITRVHKATHGLNDWVIVGAAGDAGDCETIHAVRQAVVDNHSPVDAVTFADLTPYEVVICATEPCALDLCEGEPPMAVTVSNLGADEVINFLGKTWYMPEDSGLTQCVCPTTYILQQQATAYFPRVPYWQNYENWEHVVTPAANTLRLFRQAYELTYVSAGSYSQGLTWIIAARNATATLAGSDRRFARHYFGSGVFAPVTSSGLGVLYPGPTNAANTNDATINNYRISDVMFGQVTSGNITFKWEKGNINEWL